MIYNDAAFKSLLINQISKKEKKWDDILCKMGVILAILLLIGCIVAGKMIYDSAHTHEELVTNRFGNQSYLTRPDSPHDAALQGAGYVIGIAGSTLGSPFVALVLTSLARMALKLKWAKDRRQVREKDWTDADFQRLIEKLDVETSQTINVWHLSSEKQLRILDQKIGRAKLLEKAGHALTARLPWNDWAQLKASLNDKLFRELATCERSLRLFSYLVKELPLHQKMIVAKMAFDHGLFPHRDNTVDAAFAPDALEHGPHEFEVPEQFTKYCPFFKGTYQIREANYHTLFEVARITDAGPILNILVSENEAEIPNLQKTLQRANQYFGPYFNTLRRFLTDDLLALSGYRAPKVQAA